MPSFVTAPLADVLARIIDHRGRTPKKLGGDFVSSGVRVLSALNVQDGRVDDSDRRYVTEEMWHRWMPEKLRSGDVLLTSEAPLGQTAYLTSDDPLCLGQRLFALRADERRLHGRFLYYYLRSDAGQSGLAARATGTTVVGIRQSELLRVEVPLPPLRDQQAIAAVLGTLDDKIEQNHRTARALEGLARATFKAWFVDYEPVKAKVAGATSFPGMPPATFAALPDCLADSPLGPVPQGWVVGTMGDVGEQRRDQIAPGEVDDETPYIGLEHMPRRDIALSEWGRAASVTSSKSRFCRGDVLYGKLRPYFHKVGPAPLDGVCSTDIVVLYSKRVEYAAWLLMLVSSDNFVAHTDRSSAGTKMPRTNWKDMAVFPVALPPLPVAAAYQTQVGPMLDMIEAGIHESIRLAALRDYLLPRLLNGGVQVRPSQAEG